MPDRRYNAKLILPDGTEKPSLIVYYPPTLTGEEVEDIGRQILAVFSGTLCSDVEDEEGRGTTTEDMLDAGVLDADGVNPSQAPSSDVDGAVAALENARVLLESGTPDDVRQHITHAIGLLRPSGVTATPAPDDLPPVHIDVERMRKALAGPRILIPPGLSIEEVIAFINAHAAGVKATRTLPHPGSPEASAMLDSLLAEYNYPANTKNAARAGWEAAERWLRTAGVKVDAPRKPTDADVAEWAERHDLRGSATDLRCAFEDAQTLHMAYGVPPVQAPSCCEWREEDPYGAMSGTYASACGELWSFIDGGPTENNVRFCHGCGKPVDVAPPLPDPLAGVDDDAPRTDGVPGRDADTNRDQPPMPDGADR
jgi:hypothetical protein